MVARLIEKIVRPIKAVRIKGAGGNERGSIIIAERLVKLPPCTLLKRNEIIMIVGLIDVEH